MKKISFLIAFALTMNLSAQLRFLQPSYICYHGAPGGWTGDISGFTNIGNVTYSIVRGNSLSSVRGSGSAVVFNTTTSNGFTTVQVSEGANTDTTVVEVRQYVAATGISVASTYHTMNTLGSTHQIQATPIPSNATLIRSSGPISYHLVSGTCVSLSSSGLVTAIANGTATVESRLPHAGQTFVATTTIVVNTATSVEKLAPQAIAFEVYPNPVQDNCMVQIQSNEQNIQADYRMFITNTFGQVVLEKYLPVAEQAQTFSIDTKNLAPGLYQLTLQNEKNERSTKIIIK